MGQPRHESGDQFLAIGVPAYRCGKGHQFAKYRDQVSLELEQIVRSSARDEDVRPASQMTTSSSTQSGSSMRDLASDLQRDGVQAFADSFDSLLASIKEVHRTLSSA